MNPVDCPRCHGSCEGYIAASDVECTPAEYPPCDLCQGKGSVPEEMAMLYLAGLWLWACCDECGEGRLCVDDGLMVLCAACWPVVVEVSQQEAAS